MKNVTITLADSHKKKVPHNLEHPAGRMLGCILMRSVLAGLCGDMKATKQVTTPLASRVGEKPPARGFWDSDAPQGPGMTLLQMVLPSIELPGPFIESTQ